MPLKPYTPEDIQRYVKSRTGEKKYGDYVHCGDKNSEDFLTPMQRTKADYVLLGIPEDIGIQVNLGKKGASTAWEATLKMLLNTQNNTQNRGSNLYLLGHFIFTEEIAVLHTLDLHDKNDLKKAGKLVEIIDKEITYIIHKIVASGKKPIIVGGGHNNAYGIIKGCALALNNAINAVNFDAHSDFRKKERRHSGNGFSYAFLEGFLNKYHIFGLHENYTSKKTFRKLKKYAQRIQYDTFEAIEIEQQHPFLYYLENALAYINDHSFGIELDCDAIADIPSSAMTPSGFTVNQARRFVSFMKRHQNACYLHICEAAPNSDNEMEMQQVGKLIAYLITDFIK